MQGALNTDLEPSKAVISHDIRGVKGRDSLLPVRLSIDADGRQTVETLKFSGSSNFIRFATANGLVFVERESELKQGETAKVFRLE